MAVNLSENAFSKDGYIVSQNNTASIKYGRLDSSYNGCGWIAAYNLLHALDMQKSPRQVHGALQKGLCFGGYMGTGPRRLRKWLAGQGVQTKTAMRPKKAASLALQGSAGIVMYMQGIGLHYVAYKKDETSGQMQFWNAQDGNANHWQGMAQFLKNNAKLPLVYLMAVC